MTAAAAPRLSVNPAIRGVTIMGLAIKKKLAARTSTISLVK
jgi:hypothetical protein